MTTAYKWFRRTFLCWMLWPFFFHRLRVVQEFDQHRRKLLCDDCGTYFAMSDIEQAVLPWDEDYERIICDMYQISRTNR